MPRPRLGDPVSAASLGFFRLCFGLVVLVSAARTIALGWIEPQYTEPRFVFSYAGLEWIRIGPPWCVQLRYALLVAFGALLAAGVRARSCAAAIGLLFAWNHLADRALYLNHHHLVCLFALLLAFAPSDRAFARGAATRPGTIPRGWLWLFRAQVALVYVHAGLAKLHPDWLFEAQPLRLWFAERDHLALLGPLLARPEAAPLAAVAGLCFDLTIPFLLLWPRSRALAMAAVIVFHVATALLFPIGVFPWLMIAAATLLLPADWPRRLFARRGEGGAKAPTDYAAAAPRRIGYAAAALFLLWQLLWPLRTHLVPGDPLWHERGFRFSWRVMLMEKQGQATFYVREGEGQGRRATVRPEETLTPIQVRMMATQPDMILDYARALRRDFAARGWRAPQVRVESWVTLNGDPAAPLIDPDLDLAAIDPGPFDRDWILPRPPRTLHAEDPVPGEDDP